MFLTRPFEVIWMKNISDQVTFDEGLKDIWQNNKTVGLLQKLQDILPRSALVTIHKYFNSIPFRLCWCVLWSDVSTKNRIITTQCCIRFNRWQLEKSQEKSLEALQQNSCYRKLWWFYKLCSKETPDYLNQLIPTCCKSLSYKVCRFGVFQKFFTTECYQHELFLRNSTCCSI